MPDLPAPPSSRPPAWLSLRALHLEPVLIATAWALGLAGLNRLNVMPGVLSGLGLCVWMVYALDRLLDDHAKARHDGLTTGAFFRSPAHGLRLTGLVLGAGLTGWLAIFIVPESLLWTGLTLAAAIFLYLGIFAGHGSQVFFRGVLPLLGSGAAGFILTSPISDGVRYCLAGLILTLLFLLMSRPFQQRLRSSLHKDVTGGILFAMGVTTWTRFIRDGTDPVGGFVEFSLLTCLFIANLTGISSPRAHHRWLAAGAGVAFSAWLLADKGDLALSMKTLAAACATGFLLLWLLDRFRPHLTRDTYRLLADLAVLLPAMPLVWKHF